MSVASPSATCTRWFLRNKTTLSVVFFIRQNEKLVDDCGACSKSVQQIFGGHLAQRGKVSGAELMGKACGSGIDVKAELAAIVIGDNVGHRLCQLGQIKRSVLTPLRCHPSQIKRIRRCGSLQGWWIASIFTIFIGEIGDVSLAASMDFCNWTWRVQLAENRHELRAALVLAGSVTLVQGCHQVGNQPRAKIRGVITVPREDYRIKSGMGDIRAGIIRFVNLQVFKQTANNESA